MISETAHAIYLSSMTLTPAQMHPAIRTATDFRARALSNLHRTPQLKPISETNDFSPSDFDLNPDARQELWKGGSGTPAAVLVPVVARTPLTLLLTQRTAHLPAHAGQIAFPGGKIDREDDSACDAALREAEEEVGLDSRLAEPLGYLDTYRTVTNFAVVPVVALIDPDVTLNLNHNEVAETFEVPLSFLMDPHNHTKHSRTYAGTERYYYAMPYGQRYIWGATAGILRNMHERLFAT